MIITFIDVNGTRWKYEGTLKKFNDLVAQGESITAVRLADRPEDRVPHEVFGMHIVSYRKAS